VLCVMEDVVDAARRVGEDDQMQREEKGTQDGEEYPKLLGGGPFLRTGGLHLAVCMSCGLRGWAWGG